MSKNIKVREDVHNCIMVLKRKHKYISLSDLIDDMSSFFSSNDVSPRSTKEPVVKKLQAFRESLFKKLGAHERDYFKAHYNDFNLVSGYIKDEFDTIKKMIADYGSRSPKSITKLKEVSAQKSVEREKEKSVSNGDYEVLKSQLEKEKKQKLEGIEYVFKLFEKNAQSKGNKFEVDKVAFSEFKMSVENIIKR